ncbi:hypothetical protein SAY87_026144 [Trapa incisa]|uniref:Uncharacterized protein n=1 Tax=Trapa incisa TaxID=236973 RepID=A0AAN7GUY3_9MYRT|nr:hypothetical protein SAY87_026144 [Trapa incisa]
MCLFERGNQIRSSTLEARRHCLLASTDKKGEGDGDVEVDAEDVGLDGGAEAEGRLEVGQTVEEGTARAGGWGSDHHIDKAEEVSADSELQSVLRAGLLGRRYHGRGRTGLRLRLRLWGQAGVAGGGG